MTEKEKMKKKKVRQQRKLRKRANNLLQTLNYTKSITVKIKTPPPKFSNLTGEKLARAINHAMKKVTPCKWKEKTQEGYLTEAYLTDMNEVWAKFIPFQEDHKPSKETPPSTMAFQFAKYSTGIVVSTPMWTDM